ncbi:Maf family protein [Enemella sp. A6]|uniref:Maf family protein n=1 Tax=Enemella sp. A6 TaxID=3440152 RepID=UPI003EBBDD9B
MILGSASPARLATLRSAGVHSEVLVSGVDEDDVDAPSPADLAGVLAELKGDAVAQRVSAELISGARIAEAGLLVIGADSVLEFDGRPMGKPGTAEIARSRWEQMRGRDGVLHTGHRLVLLGADGRIQRAVTEVAGTRVWHADLSDAEIEAYIATGEPLQVAGGFTVDGLGGPFIDRIEGDFHNVVGLSLPLVRRILAGWDIGWHELRAANPA